MNQDREQSIRTALMDLRHDDDSHWTADGAPKLSVVQTLANDPTIKRTEIQEIAPNLMRGQIGTETGGAPAGKDVLAPALSSEQDRIVQRLAAAKERLAAAHRGVDSARAELRNAEKEQTAAKLAHDKAFPPRTPAEVIKEHHASQMRQRAEQAAMGRVAPLQAKYLTRPRGAAYQQKDANGRPIPLTGAVAAQGPVTIRQMTPVHPGAGA
jgi:hypothetical protein